MEIKVPTFKELFNAYFFYLSSFLFNFSLIQYTSNVELAVLDFKHFGKNHIKQLGFSPDSFIQIAIQV